ncbi:hypothetical protein, partial [Enterobacter hormaechei]|uniref:hypothetical protein n=1 Tax=Enterobacter hormaechei TaxID=158836 RepID=UPI0023E449C8
SGQFPCEVKHSFDLDFQVPHREIDLEVVEALLARKYSKGRGKYKGKVPLIYFSCEEIGHIAAWCLKNKNKDEMKGHKCIGKKDFKSFKDKGKKTCFMAKDSNDSNDEEEDEIVYIGVKDESDNDEEMALISHMSINDTWIDLGMVLRYKI